MILINFHIPIRCKESLWWFVIFLIIYAFQQPKHVISKLQSNSALCLGIWTEKSLAFKANGNGLLLFYFNNIFSFHFVEPKRNKRWTAMVFMQTLYSLIAARTIQLNRFAFLNIFCPAFIEMIYNLIIAFHVSFLLLLGAHKFYMQM